MVDSGELALKDPKKTIAVLCGQKEMTEQTIEVLESWGATRTNLDELLIVCIVVWRRPRRIIIITISLFFYASF